MPPSSRYVWSVAAAALALVALAALAVGLVAGPLAALMTMSGSLLLLYTHHVHNLCRLVAWTQKPVGTPPPHGAGSWHYAFAGLARRARLGDDAREQLSTALERFREASEAMPDGVMYLSASDRIEWINTTAAQHFGLDASRDQGAPVTTLVREPEFVRLLGTRGDAEPVIFRSGRRPGLTLLVQAVPFGDGQRMIVSRDISQLEKLETVRRDFIANVSHELRTPLTVVIGFLETLIDAHEDLEPAEALRYLRLAFDQSCRMQSLIEDLLTLSALETGAPAAAEEKIAVGPLLADIARDTELLSGGRHDVGLVVAAGSEGAVLLGSGKELRSAFANLASNAVRYTPDGGRIRLLWRRVGGGAEFAVEDTGIGIEARHLPRLTERFYRVDRGRSRETGGTGLGLAIVKHILSRHDAQLLVESEYGKGSRFSARFPAARLARDRSALRN
ncbi:phosphate regulon sensor histidine kinase PhoR [Aromatoleum buckelii]|uniref:Phosphate regulon sensor protein PhoR n=1 Tax=Aromatoleum buckelii TaxID=200254 RepID=A0ABX1N0C3_9RHOO|nr:phosphate regulon sensor histidine kinase PhoR [Aromatoleum buckelii]